MDWLVFCASSMRATTHSTEFAGTAVPDRFSVRVPSIRLIIMR